MKNQVVEVSISDITPYENNPRNNKDSIEKVARSIENYGFLQPIVVDSNGVIIVGHTRFEAAKTLGLTKVPVIYANDLSENQAREYRLTDNKVGESSKWIDSLLYNELEILSVDDPGFDPTDFGFNPIDEIGHRKAWSNVSKNCNLTKSIRVNNKVGYYFTSFFPVSKDGRPLEEIKEDKTLVDDFADNLCDYVEKNLGTNLENGDWCICTTPRRRHATGFHFATAICEAASKKLKIPFYEDIVSARTKHRLDGDFVLEKNPKESNIILYDDILTTGITVRDTRKLLLSENHNVLVIVAIRNL